MRDKKSKLKDSKPKSAFTTVELLVAMTIFVVSMTIASAAFVSGLRTQRAIVSLVEVNNNVGLVLEQISREARTGYNLQKISSSEIKFTDALGRTVQYRLWNNAIERGTSSSGGALNYERITADNIIVERFNVILLNDPDYPPRLTITMSVSSANRYITGVKTNVETTVSTRNI